MPDYLLLRFRDLVAENSTIDEHNKISEQNGTVWWGWWKKPNELMPVPALDILKDEIRQYQERRRIYLIDSATHKVYQSELHEIVFNSSEEVDAPQGQADTICPPYYENKKLHAWFRIARIEELGSDREVLKDFVWSKINRTWNPETQNYSEFGKNALRESFIGERITEEDFLDSNISLWFITPVREMEMRSRGYIVDNFSSVPWRVNGNYIIHLSDLHFGSRHAYRNQLARRTGHRIAKESLAEQLFQDFEKISLNDKNIALIVITGDLTWDGNAHEFANAKDFLDTLGRRLGLHPSQIIVVPGNHDIEWRDGKEDINDDAEFNYRNFCREFYGTKPSKSFLRIHRFNIEGRDVSIIGLNSCRLESKSNAGLGYVGREQILEMQRFIHQNSLTDLKIALTHHHLLPVNFIEEIDWDQKRVSIMLDADDVLRSLICVKTRMVLHGHQHQPYFSDIRRIIQGYVDPFDKDEEITLDGTIAVIGGGSIGVDRSHINFVGRNTYNIIDLNDQESNGSKIKVTTRMQSPVGPGFIKYQTTSFDI